MDDPQRGTGRTTGLMLKALSQAILNPGWWITFQDHFDADHRHHLFYFKQLAASAGLSGLKFKASRHQIRVGYVAAERIKQGAA